MIEAVCPLYLYRDVLDEVSSGMFAVVISNRMSGIELFVMLALFRCRSSFLIDRSTATIRGTRGMNGKARRSKEEFPG